MQTTLWDLFESLDKPAKIFNYGFVVKGNPFVNDTTLYRVTSLNRSFQELNTTGLSIAPVIGSGDPATIAKDEDLYIQVVHSYKPKG